MGKYSAKFRAKVVDYANEHGVGSAARKFDVSGKSVSRWRVGLSPANRGQEEDPNRRPDGTFKPGNNANPLGTSGDKQRAQRRAEELAAGLAVDGYELYRKLLDVELGKTPEEIDFARVRLILKDAAEYGLTKPKQVTETQHTGKDGEPLTRPDPPQGHDQYTRDIAATLARLGFSTGPASPDAAPN